MRNPNSPLTSLVSDEDPGRQWCLGKMVSEHSPPWVLWELQLHLGSGQIAWGEVGGDFSCRDTAASVFGFSLAASVTF